VVAEAVAVAGGAAAAAFWWVSGSEDRAKKAEYAELQGRFDEFQQERARKAYMEPRDGGKGTWTEAEVSRARQARRSVTYIVRYIYFHDTSDKSL
jgi:type II secretory pathway pseudopilin PulG